MIFIICAILLWTNAGAQQELATFNKERIKITRNGMFVLGAWGAANIAVGAIGMAGAHGEAKYFQQMNLIWGTVNFAIAGTTLLGLRKKQTGASWSGSFREQVGMEKTFLINGGLDLVYLTAGLYCLEKGNNTTDPDKYRGYGKSLLMQGGGLLLFDAIMYFTHTRHGKRLYKMLDHLQISGNSAGISVTF